MVKFIGSVNLPGICLKYFVFGNRREGYGIRILKENGDCVNQFVSRNLLHVLNLASQLQRCSVFPDNLCEILEDLRCGCMENQVDKVVFSPYTKNQQMKSEGDANQS